MASRGRFIGTTVPDLPVIDNRSDRRRLGHSRRDAMRSQTVWPGSALRRSPPTIAGALPYTTNARRDRRAIMVHAAYLLLDEPRPACPT